MFGLKEKGKDEGQMDETREEIKITYLLRRKSREKGRGMLRRFGPTIFKLSKIGRIRREKMLQLSFDFLVLKSNVI